MGRGREDGHDLTPKAVANGEISDKTRIPLGWAITLGTAIAAGVLYVAVKVTVIESTLDVVKRAAEKAWTVEQQRSWSDLLRSENKHLNMNVPEIPKDPNR